MCGVPKGQRIYFPKSTKKTPNEFIWYHEPTADVVPEDGEECTLEMMYLSLKCREKCQEII